MNNGIVKNIFIDKGMSPFLVAILNVKFIRFTRLSSEFTEYSELSSCIAI